MIIGCFKTSLDHLKPGWTKSDRQKTSKKTKKHKANVIYVPKNDGHHRNDSALIHHKVYQLLISMLIPYSVNWLCCTVKWEVYSIYSQLELNVNKQNIDKTYYIVKRYR